jgi:hypothetical protein
MRNDSKSLHIRFIGYDLRGGTMAYHDLVLYIWFSISFLFPHHNLFQTPYNTDIWFSALSLAVSMKSSAFNKRCLQVSRHKI